MKPFDRPIPEIIRARSSLRTYKPDPIPDESRSGLEEALAAPPPGPFGGRVALHLLTAFDAAAQGAGKLGTYGMIRGARNYLVGVVEDGPRAMEDFGYVFEAGKSDGGGYVRCVRSGP